MAAITVRGKVDKLLNNKPTMATGVQELQGSVVVATYHRGADIASIV